MDTSADRPKGGRPPALDEADRRMMLAQLAVVVVRELPDAKVESIRRQLERIVVRNTQHPGDSPEQLVRSTETEDSSSTDPAADLDDLDEEPSSQPALLEGLAETSSDVNQTAM